MTWVSIERAVKFTVALGWGTWELVGVRLIIHGEPNVVSLAFIASVLGVSEAIRAMKDTNKEVAN